MSCRRCWKGYLKFMSSPGGRRKGHEAQSSHFKYKEGSPKSTKSRWWCGESKYREILSSCRCSMSQQCQERMKLHVWCCSD
mmetsp:Transcript_14788/g.34599  ORF Transcript_14788/g.34599 Transcript_14788/m.34599 type:complete len:81 (+) Transcript_14788:1148-1390(+)